MTDTKKVVYEVDYYTMSGGGIHTKLVRASSEQNAIEYVKKLERQPLDGIRIDCIRTQYPADSVHEAD